MYSLRLASPPSDDSRALGVFALRPLAASRRHGLFGKIGRALCLGPAIAAALVVFYAVLSRDPAALADTRYLPRWGGLAVFLGLVAAGHALRKHRRAEREATQTAGRELVLAQEGVLVARPFLSVPSVGAGGGPLHYFIPWAELVSWKPVPAEHAASFPHHEIVVATQGRETSLRLHGTFREAADEARFLTLVGKRLGAHL